MGGAGRWSQLETPEHAANASAQPWLRIKWKLLWYRMRIIHLFWGTSIAQDYTHGPAPKASICLSRMSLERPLLIHSPLR